MPTAPRATPTSTRPASERRRPATARTTAAVAPVSTAANRGCSPVRPRRSKVSAPVKATRSTKVSSGATPASAAQPVARPSRRHASAAAAKAARTSGAGSTVVAPMPPARATTDTAKAERSTTERSVIAAHPKVAAAIIPSARRSVDQSSSAWMPMAATSIGTRKVPRCRSAPAVAGRVAFRLRPAIRHPPVASSSTPSLTVSGMAPQCTATNTEAAARSRKAPVPVTQTAPVRVGSGRDGVVVVDMAPPSADQRHPGTRWTP